MILILSAVTAFAQTPSAAWAEIGTLQEDVAAFSVVSFSDNDQANAELLLDEKSAEVAGLELRGQALIAQYDDPKVTSAALCLTGSLYLSYSELLKSAPLPAGLQPAEIPLYQGAILEVVAPLEDKGFRNLSGSVAAAQSAGISTEWSERSAALLSTRAELTR